LSEHGVFYPQALYNDLVFEITLAPASQLKCKLTNMQLEYEMIRRKTLADEAYSVYSSGKEFTYDHVTRAKVVPLKKDTDTRINIKVDAQRKSLKAILLLFVEPYTVGTRDSDSWICVFQN